MAETYKKLGQGTLTGSGTQDTLYTVPASTTAIIKHIRLVNYSTSSCMVKLWHDGTTDAYLILPATTIEAGGWGEWDGTFIMEASDTLNGEASAASSISYVLYGMEVS